MKREDAIKTLKELWRETNDPWYEEVYNMAINALEADRKTEPQTDKWSHDCIGCGRNELCRFAFTDAVKICRYIKDGPQTCSVNGRPYDCGNCEYFRCTADEPQTERSRMIECTLHNLLTSCQYPQVFWIYQMNDYDENILLTKGTKQEMLEDDENSFDLIDHINDVVEYWTIREDGAMFVRIRMDDRAKELYSDDYVKKWDRYNPLKRPYLYSAEMDDFTNCIYGSSEYMHPYGDPLDCHHWEEQTERSGE